MGLRIGKVRTVLSDKLTLVVVVYNSMAVLPSFFQRLQGAPKEERCPVIVCDNASTDGVEEFLRSRWPQVTFMRSERNEGYGAALNRGILASRTPFVAPMNPDVGVEPGGLARLVGFLDEKPTAAGVSGIIVHVRGAPDESPTGGFTRPRRVAVHFGYENAKTRLLFYSGFQTKWGRHAFLVPWSMAEPADSIPVSRLNGSFGVFRKDALVAAGLYDPRLFLYFEEDDMAIRLRRMGYGLYVTDRAMIVHTPGKGSQLSGSMTTDKILLNSQYLFFRKHRGGLYAWVCFLLIWSTLTMVSLYQLVSGSEGAKRTLSLWKWHLDSLLAGGGLPRDTLPGGGKEGIDYGWRSRC